MSAWGRESFDLDGNNASPSGEAQAKGLAAEHE